MLRFRSIPQDPLLYRVDLPDALTLAQRARAMAASLALVAALTLLPLDFLGRRSLASLDLSPARPLGRADAGFSCGGHLSPAANCRDSGDARRATATGSATNLGQFRFQTFNFFSYSNYFTQLLDC